MTGSERDALGAHQQHARSDGERDAGQTIWIEVHANSRPPQVQHQQHGDDHDRAPDARRASRCAVASAALFRGCRP